MPDLAHLWGNDLSWSPTGDLACVDIPAVTQQRVLRRLLTNLAEYIWSPGYGAGLASYVGQPGAATAIRAAIRGQIFKEAAVAQTPAPLIDLIPSTTGTLYVHIRYADATTGATETVAFQT
jgi:hypothetical protein